jgi:hypothetical protein
MFGRNACGGYQQWQCFPLYCSPRRFLIHRLPAQTQADADWTMAK